MIVRPKILLVKEFSVKRSVVTDLIICKDLIGWTELF